MSSVVLDASAALAVIHGEPGSDLVSAFAGDSVISAVNVVEVITKMIDEGYSQAHADETFEVLRVEIAVFDERQARLSGLLRTPTRHRGLSLGDRACLALASKLGLPVLTADRLWEGLDVGVEVRLIR